MSFVNISFNYGIYHFMALLSYYGNFNFLILIDSNAYIVSVLALLGGTTILFLDVVNSGLGK